MSTITPSRRFAGIALAGALAVPQVFAGSPAALPAAVPPGTAVGPGHPWPGDAAPDYAKYTGLKAVSTQVQGDVTPYTLGEGYTDIGRPMTVKCTAACVVAVTSMVEVTSIDGLWQICPVVDGLTGVSGCPWQGITPQTESADVTGNGTFVWHLSAGTHTLQPMVYLIYGGQLLNWTLVATQYQ